MESSNFLQFMKEKRFNFNLQDRVEEIKANRRSCRASAALKMRNIGAMTPIDSPIIVKKTLTKNKNVGGGSPKKQLKFESDKPDREDGSSRRMKMFKAWQQEKKKKQEQKKMAKPPFKVPHIKTTSKFNLDPIYDNIKGKPVGSFLKKHSEKFVPIGSHKFKPPSNVKPIVKPIVESKIPHRMNLRPRNVAPVVPTNVRAVLPPSKPVGERKEKKQNLPKKKTASKANGTVTIEGKTLRVLVNNVAGKVTKPEKKTLRRSVRREIVDPPEKIEMNSPSSVNNVAGKVTKPEKKTLRRSVRREIVDPPEKIEMNSPSSDEHLAEEKVNKNKVKNKRKSVAQSQELLVTTPELILISDSKETQRKSPVKENQARKRWSVKHEDKMERRTPLRKRHSFLIEEVGGSSSDELLFENENQAKKNRRKNSKTPLMEENRSNNSSLSTAYSIDMHSSQSDSPVTPKNKEAVTYVSPFVTMSRGKENARREYQRRSTVGGDDDKNTSPKAAAQYFTQVLADHNKHLSSLCAKWHDYKLENSAEEVHDMINVAIGQTELLLKKKFKQFEELIELCKTGKSEKPIKSLDLHGYYDTMQIQIVNLEKRFQNLENLKSNNWEEIAPPPKKSKPKVKKVTKKKSAPVASGIRAMIEAKRKQLALKPTPTEIVEAVDTPKIKRISKLRTSLRDSLTKKRISSPGLTMMKVTQGAKSRYSTPNNLNNTQPKSILKSEGAKLDNSTKRKSKAVLFKVSPAWSTPPSKLLRKSSRKLI